MSWGDWRNQGIWTYIVPAWNGPFEWTILQMSTSSWDFKNMILCDRLSVSIILIPHG